MTITDGFCLDFPEDIFKNAKNFQSMSLNEPVYPNFYSNNNSLIEVSFLSDKKTFRPILGEIVKTSNFIVKLGLKKKTNLLCMMCFVLNIKNTVKFRKFIDFQYFPFCESFYWDKAESGINFIRTLKYFSNKKPQTGSIPVDLLPPFSHRSLVTKKDFKFDQILNTRRRRKTRLKKKENFSSKTIVPVGIDQRSFGENEFDFTSYSIEYTTVHIPLVPPRKVRKSLKTTPLFCIGMILRLFKKRPMWTINELSKFVQPQLRRYIKRILPFISYRFQGKNPFKRIWIRLTFDPRKNFLKGIYNSLLNCRTKKNKPSTNLPLFWPPPT